MIVLQLFLRILQKMPDPVLAALARMLFSRSWRRFQREVRDPRPVQLGRLLDILEWAKDTEFGRSHGFSGIRTVADYQRAVPIRAYEELEPFLSRMFAGEDNVLIPEAPFFFAMTSGTTGAAKYLPITKRFLSELRLPRRVWMRQVMQAFPGLVRGKVLSMHSPQIVSRSPQGVPCGSITVAVSGSPEEPSLPVRDLGADIGPRRLFLVEDFERKYYLLLRMAAQEDLSLAAAINPSTLVLLARKLDQWADRLAADLERGTVEGSDELPEPLRTEILSRARPAPLAAERIRAARGSGRAVLPTDLWPGIRGLLCWKGGSAPFYLAQLRELFPGRKIMDYGYLATEGGFSLPLSPEGAAGVLAVGGHFLEFVPEALRARGEDSPALLADELVVGERYRVIITASNGLYRYDINDVVECVGRYGNTAEVAFVHKGGNMLSITGEKIAESQVVQAVESASRETRVSLVGFSVSVELGEVPRYVFGVELEDPATEDEELRRLLEACEAGLRKANIEYAAKRDSLRLGPPSLRLLTRGAFERERSRRVRAGAPDSHVKPPHLIAELARLESMGVERSLEATE